MTPSHTTGPPPPTLPTRVQTPARRYRGRRARDDPPGLRDSLDELGERSDDLLGRLLRQVKQRPHRTNDRTASRSHASSHDSTRSAPQLAAAVGPQPARAPRPRSPHGSESDSRPARRRALPFARTRKATAVDLPSCTGRLGHLISWRPPPEMLNASRGGVPAARIRAQHRRRP